ncbi:hypothetical protein RRG08_034892 [Elysia crispata]|uniref:Uncharacterized protein n=1 Tax=Elysia crispata TaxID=231223 RepID=A0AAE0ZSI9_9GAST|nr:hypothetical protein RRG08_034892 [Elysia crispata]
MLSTIYFCFSLFGSVPIPESKEHFKEERKFVIKRALEEEPTNASKMASRYQDDPVFSPGTLPGNSRPPSARSNHSVVSPVPSPPPINIALLSTSPLPTSAMLYAAAASGGGLASDENTCGLPLHTMDLDSFKPQLAFLINAYGINFCLSVLNYFRSLERTLTINDMGLASDGDLQRRARPALKNVYMLEFHPTLTIASRIPSALQHAYWIYKKQAGEMGYPDFHLNMRFVQFEFASFKEKAGKPPPIFITAVQEDDTAVDKVMKKRPRRLLSKDGRHVLNIWFIPHYTELLVMFKHLDDESCSRAMSFTLSIVATLHDMLQYLSAHARLGSSHARMGSQTMEFVSADWGGTEGIVSQSQPLSRVQQPLESYRLLRFFLLLWKSLDMLKEDWGRRKMMVEAIDTSYLFREFNYSMYYENLLRVNHQLLFQKEQVDELMDKEARLKRLEEEQDRSSKLTHLAYEKAKRDVDIKRKQLNHERLLKLDAFQRVDTLQSQVGGRLRSRIAEQLLNELEPDTHRTIVQLAQLQLEGAGGSGSGGLNGSGGRRDKY